MKKVICVDNSSPENWVMIEKEDYLTLGGIYTVEREVVEKNGELSYNLVEKPPRENGVTREISANGNVQYVQQYIWVKYNANRFIDLPEDGEIPEIEFKTDDDLTPEEQRAEFIRKMKFLGITEKGIENWLGLLEQKAEKKKS